MFRMIKKVVKDPTHAIFKLRFHICKVFGYRDYKKFIVLSRNRTGSNMLISMLNSHPSIYSRYEIFRTLDGNSVKKIMNGIYSKYPRFVKAVGFKIFYYHPVDDESGAIWDKLTEMEDLHVIHLKRRNILRTILSGKIASKTNVWATKDGSGEIGTKDKKVYLNADELEKALKKSREWEIIYGKMFKSKPMVEIYYEDLVSNPQDEFQKITNMLNLKPCKLKTAYRKQNPEKMSELISNYESIKRSFTDTEWSQFFDY